jgi:opacity protein-like surface antigen
MSSAAAFSSAPRPNFDWLSSTTSSSNTVVLQNPTGTPTGSTGSMAVNNRWAWTAGADLEWAFWGNWCARLEYDYVGLNGQTFYAPNFSRRTASG